MHRKNKKWVPDEDSDKAFLDDCQEFFAECKLLESEADASNSVKFLLAFDEKKSRLRACIRSSPFEPLRRPEEPRLKPRRLMA